MRRLVCLVSGFLIASCGQASKSPTTATSDLTSLSASLSPSQIDAGGRFISCGEFMVKKDDPNMYITALPDPGRIFQDSGQEEIGIGRVESLPNADGVCEYALPSISLQEGKWYWWNLQKMQFQKSDGTVLSLSTTNCRTRQKQGDQKVKDLIIGGQDRYEGIVGVQVVQKKMLVSVCALEEGGPAAIGDRVDVDVEISIIE